LFADDFTSECVAGANPDDKDLFDFGDREGVGHDAKL
jgi:hypothetical protein